MYEEVEVVLPSSLAVELDAEGYSGKWIIKEQPNFEGILVAGSTGVPNSW